MGAFYLCQLNKMRMDNPWGPHSAMWCNYPDSKAHGANMGPIWGQQDPGGPHVGPMNLAIWVLIHVVNGVTYQYLSSMLAN